MKKVFTLLLFLLFTGAVVGQVPNNNARISEPITKYEASNRMADHAERLMEMGNYKEAIKTLTHAQQLDNNSIRYANLLAKAYIGNKEYAKAVKLLESTSGPEDVSPYHYLLLGSAYEKMGKTDAARVNYHSGLQTFDKSGELFAAAGRWHQQWGEADSSLWYFREGMTQNPTEPENYYQLAMHHSKEGNHAWTILHGEAFMLLEPGSERTAEMSKLLFETYQKAISIGPNKKISVDFGQKKLSLDKQKVGVEERLPFPHYFQKEMKMAIAKEKRNWKDKAMPSKLTIEMIHRIRWYFQEAWFMSDSYKNYDSPLFEFYQEIAAAGYLKAFDYWYLMKGNQSEFDEWYERNGALYDKFVDWFQDNDLEISGKRVFFSGS